ncbi:hypothetical protein L1987_32958 [Smallanthus sonchifolius]|uniref:Uncharacterized protein n=1 Tax=Smallanthus sonchifolius TaxID=185202 RepID=A0ACB9HR07_9ASTR|nr:hypothetical protein L1987_32958 [Smallanthus sonchifolius]
MVGKGKGPNFIRKYAPPGNSERNTNSTESYSGTNSEYTSGTFQNLGEIETSKNFYETPMSYYVAPTLESYNQTYVNNYSYLEKPPEIPYEHHYTLEGEERADSNRPYGTYHSTNPTPIHTPRTYEETPGEERSATMQARIAELERIEVEKDAKITALQQALIRARGRLNIMSIRTGPSTHTRGRKKQAEEALEKEAQAEEMQKTINKGIEDAIPTMLEAFERAHAAKAEAKNKGKEKDHTLHNSEHNESNITIS